MGPLPDVRHGVSGSRGLGRAGGPVAGCFSAFGEEVGWDLVRLGAPWWQARGCSAVDVVEDLADEVWIGHICNHAQLPAAERAEGDVYCKDALQSQRPSQWRGGEAYGRIVAVAE